MPPRRPKIKKELLLPAKSLPERRFNYREFLKDKFYHIQREFYRGFRFLESLDNTVTFFGSARTKPNDFYYKEAEKLAFNLSKMGYTIVTGGGPGIMEAANKGAFKAGGISVGVNISLKEGQRMNKFVNKWIGFHYFFVRKLVLSFMAKAYIFFPGGFGTLDEFFELIMLVQTKKLPHDLLIICIGEEFWKSLDSWIDKIVFRKFKNIDPEDREIYRIRKNAKEALKDIQEFYLS